MPFRARHSWRIGEKRHFIGSVLAFAYFVTISSIRNEPHDSDCVFSMCQRSNNCLSEQHRTNE